MTCCNNNLRMLQNYFIGIYKIFNNFAHYEHVYIRHIHQLLRHLICDLFIYS